MPPILECGYHNAIKTYEASAPTPPAVEKRKRHSPIFETYPGEISAGQIQQVISVWGGLAGKETMRPDAVVKKEEGLEEEGEDAKNVSLVSHASQGE
jgi:hypothetical protein